LIGRKCSEPFFDKDKGTTPNDGKDRKNTQINQLLVHAQFFG